MKKIVAILLLFVLILTGCTDNVSDGVVFLEEKKYEEAKEAFQKDIDKEKRLDEAYHGKGIACFELGEYGEAAKNFELAIKNEAKASASTYSLMGACYIETEEYEKALDVYKKALADENLTDKLKQEIQFNLIAVYENMGNWEAAKKQMDSYIKAYPDDERIEREAEFLETR